MDGLYTRFHAAHAWRVHSLYSQSDEIHHALAEENRLSVRSQSPEVARNDVYKLRELPLPLVQRLLGLLALRDIDKADQTLVGYGAGTGGCEEDVDNAAIHSHHPGLFLEDLLTAIRSEEHTSELQSLMRISY